MQPHSLRLALVVPFFGREAHEPDEIESFEWAAAIAAERDVSLTVITTCGRSANDDWSANYYRAGRDVSEAFPVERFRLDPRDRPAYESAVLRLADGHASDSDIETVFLEQAVRSQTLLAHVRAAATMFDAFFVRPASAATTLAVAELAADRSILLGGVSTAVVPRLVAERLGALRAYGAVDTAERERLIEIIGVARTPRVRVLGPPSETAAQALIELVRGLAALEDGRSREEALAQVAYLYPIVRRQRSAIVAMQRSRFWALRNSWFAIKRRLRLGADPVPVLAAEAEAAELGALANTYALWRYRHALRDADVARALRLLALLPARPQISIAIDARSADGTLVRRTLAALEAQLYPAWEALVVGGAVPVEGRVRAVDAAGVANAMDGDWVIFLRAGDTLERDALLELTIAALARPTAALVYTDDDALDESGTPQTPRFKPDWSPETAMSRDYIGRAFMVRREFGLREGFDISHPALAYDVVLRTAAATNGAIEHVARPLFHLVPAVLDVRHTRAVAAAAIERTGGDARLIEIVGAGQPAFAVRWTMMAWPPVTVIVPTRDRADLMRGCLESLFDRSTYPDFEVLVVDNGSREKQTERLFAEWTAREPARCRILRVDEPFNYSRLNNLAVAATVRPQLVLLNNDTVVITPDWIEALVEQTQRPEIGAAGPLLSYPDDTVQHAGIVLGILDLAGHAHRGAPAHAAGYLGRLQAPTNVSAVTGACLAVTREKYLAVGGLDESMAVAFSDVDICLKLLASGWRNVYVPYARLYHLESISRGTEDSFVKVRRAVRERESLRLRHPAIAARDPYYNPNLTRDAEDFSLDLA